MEPTPRADAGTPTAVVAEQAQVGKSVFRRYGLELLVVFVCVALPLWGFGELAEDLAEGRPFFFDTPVLEGLHSLASPLLNSIFLAFSAVGYSGGVVPADIVLVLFLAFRRHSRSATFAAIALGGSALLNLIAKHVFARARPALWVSIAPESTYSFPSGHAMGSATLACVVACLAWNTRWRWPVIVVGVLFTLGVGMSRVYLGVHYPSDILAGWAAAIAWTLGVRFIAFRRGLMTGSSKV
ncbi:PAP2 family protein [Lysobacter sp. TY2-98]|uniref:phosphatase PAP2 family protein n=1 Tax=Lysobacter sp. TY2-98 TaxID=2290922 RepID=UPI000E20008A|nr:phosphatase PAP2 family protein [Lysobacter sp. TY2-98]AXK72281.1 PAP2 family protein [Lysobacter sp. TY2-98]